MKRNITAGLLIAAMLLLLLPTAAAGNDAIKVAVFSDPHVMNPKYVANTADFDNELAQDRKMIAESMGIFQAFLNEVRNEKPDVLMINGDLSCNGAYESHVAVAKELNKLKSDMPELTILVINGNHDIHHSAYNYNTKSGNKKAVKTTNIKQFKNIYSVTYDDPNVTVFEGDDASYYATVKGYTFICIDSNNNNGHTAGKLTDEDMANITFANTLAQRRGDGVMLMMHHGIVPHFDGEETFIPEFLVENYEDRADTLADMGISLVLSGHLHRHDISAYTSQSGNTLYDVATGSTVTYPSPMRIITLSKNNGTVTADIKTKTNIYVGNFYNNYLGCNEYIPDLTEYGLKYGYDSAAITVMVNSKAKSFIKEYISGAKTQQWLINKLIPHLDDIAERIINIDIDGYHTALDAVNYVFYRNHSGTDTGELPDWVSLAVDNLNNGVLVADVIDEIKREAAGSLTEYLILSRILNNGIYSILGRLAVNICNGLIYDTNYAEDCDTVITYSYHKSILPDIAQYILDKVKLSDII